MIYRLISLIALVLTIVPSLLLYCGVINHNIVLVLALVGTVSWFISAPLWMDRELPVDAKEVEI